MAGPLKSCSPRRFLLYPSTASHLREKNWQKPLKTEHSNDLLTTYLTALQEQIGVSINETLWRQVSGTSETNP